MDYKEDYDQEQYELFDEYDRAKLIRNIIIIFGIIAVVAVIIWVW